MMITVELTTIEMSYQYPMWMENGNAMRERTLTTIYIDCSYKSQFRLLPLSQSHCQGHYYILQSYLFHRHLLYVELLILPLVTFQIFNI